MYDCFYIVEPREGWYRLHLKDTHYCLGSGDSIERLLNTLRRLVKKYRTKTKFLRAINHLEDRGLVGEKMLSLYREDYTNTHHLYSDIVKVAVKESLEEVKKDTPFNRVRKLVKTINTNEDYVTLENTRSTNEDLTTVKRPKVLVNKKRLLNI